VPGSGGAGDAPVPAADVAEGVTDATARHAGRPYHGIGLSGLVGDSREIAGVATVEDNKRITMEWHQPDTDERDDEMGVPLVLCRSRGGPYDDEAFRSGWRLGDIGSTLGRLGVSALADSIRPSERLQADLLAMAHGYTMTVEPGSDPDWLSVTFTRDRDIA
jgi:hypothetical protein